MKLLIITSLFILTTILFAAPVTHAADRLSNNPTIDGVDVAHPAPSIISKQTTQTPLSTYAWLLIPVVVLGMLSYAIYTQMANTKPSREYNDFLDKYRDHYIGRLSTAGIKGGQISRQTASEQDHERQVREYERRLQEIYNETDPDPTPKSYFN